MSQPIIHIHGPVTINIIDGKSTITPDVAEGLTRESATSLEKKSSKQLFDDDYAGRRGYDEQFLGVRVPAPDVRVERRSGMLTRFGRIFVLKYHHYSLAMNKDRRLVMWTASNVDYSPDVRGDERRDDYGGETWRLDPRIRADLQVQDDEFYQPAHKIDRGHVVRRDDTAWGATFQERAHANADTYHWTNCTPQHERFNRSLHFGGAWGLLEDRIKSEAQRLGTRLSILAGPILADDDPEDLDLKYPRQFWKVVLLVEDDQLCAYGFILDQSAILERYGLGLEAEADFGDLVEHQCSLGYIERLTGVVFAAEVLAADVMPGEESVRIKGESDLRRRRRR